MKVLMILNDPPYGSERCYNGLRLAKAMQSKQDVEVSVFLMADSVVCAKRGQKVPQGYYNAEMMIRAVVRKGRVLLCGTCMDARGLTDDEITNGTTRSTMDELATLSVDADQVLVF